MVRGNGNEKYVALSASCDYAQAIRDPQRVDKQFTVFPASSE